LEVGVSALIFMHDIYQCSGRLAIGRGRIAEK